MIRTIIFTDWSVENKEKCHGEEIKSALVRIQDHADEPAES